MSATRFVKLKSAPRGWECPPLVWVVHGRHGGCVGPHPSYEWQALGGPNSCRFYGPGDLGPARWWAEASTELRVPVPKVHTWAYLFADHARNLGSARDLPGEPQELYGKPGKGTTTGVGLRMGAMRLEWCRQGLKGPAMWLVNFGEPF